MNDCSLRKPGQDFCDECPHRAVRDECLRVGVAPLSSRTPPASWQTRVGLFLLSGLSMALVPVVIRTALRLKVEGDVSTAVAAVLGSIGLVFCVVIVIAALFGIYSSLPSRRRPKVG